MEAAYPESPSTRADDEEPDIRALRLLRAQSTTTIVIAAFLFTVAVMLMHRPFSRAEIGDQAIWDYVAQCIVRGQVPYRDVIEIKPPGSAYLGALAIEVGKLVRARDVLSLRLFVLLLAGVLSVVTYLAAQAYLRNRLAALIALAIPMVSSHFVDWMAGGIEPKLLMILFGMLTLLLIAKDKPFWAGVCSMLSCMCWQPGLLFTGIAVLIFSRYLTTGRDLRALKALIGAAIPLAGLLLYFRSKGALGELWTWTVTFNHSVYANQTLSEMRESFGHFLSISFRVLKVDLVVVIASLVGFVMFSIAQVRARLDAGPSSELFRDAIIIAPLVYLTACLFRFNAAPYLIPFFPFIGIFGAWFVVELVRLIKAGRIIKKRAIRVALAIWLPAAVLALLLGIALIRGVINLRGPILTLREQDRTFSNISAMLEPDDTLYVHGTTELLVLLNKPNLNPYIFFDSGKDDYIATRMYGGSFAAVIDEIESRAPKIAAVSRLQRVAHRADLKQWAEQHYQSLELPGYEEIGVRRR
jgi:hypothetical protein